MNQTEAIESNGKSIQVMNNHEGDVRISWPPNLDCRSTTLNGTPASEFSSQRTHFSIPNFYLF
jgi:hypothetical protein